MKPGQAKMMQDAQAHIPEARSGGRWLQRLGIAGFAFFLIKGLLWLTVPALLAYWGYR